MTRLTASQSIYFGKLPSRPDFVRSIAGSPLIDSIDHWISGSMELLSEDVRWKLIYDAAAPVDFAILRSQGRVGLVGHLRASRDAVGRRFPFLMAASFSVPEPKAFVPLCGQVLASHWAHMGATVESIVQAADFASMQTQLTTSPMALELHTDFLHQAFHRAVALIDIGAFEASIGKDRASFSFRQTVLALGMLLQPLMSKGDTGAGKGLVLPLPSGVEPRAVATAFWINLAGRFFERTSIEVATFTTLHREQPVLLIGLQGASAATLASALDAAISDVHNVSVSDAEWVDDWTEGIPRLQKLSHLLRDPSISLSVAASAFHRAFFERDSGKAFLGSSRSGR